ncbi:FecR domain-containing protein [PVC group bacterium]|nr:FecR domain-containing protein [PVC group bacterium]
MEIEGRVEVRDRDSAVWVSARLQQGLEAGDQIRTGESSLATISFKNKTEVYLRESTEFRIDDVIKKGKRIREVHVTLNIGEMLSRVKKTSQKAEPFRVKTPSAIAGVRGTQFYLKVYPAKEQASKFGIIKNVYADDLADMITEILVESGTVLFGNLDLTSSFLVNALQWGIAHPDGQVNPPLDVDNEAINTWRNQYKHKNVQEKIPEEADVRQEVRKDIEQIKEDAEAIRKDVQLDIIQNRGIDDPQKKSQH